MLAVLLIVLILAFLSFSVTCEKGVTDFLHGTFLDGLEKPYRTFKDLSYQYLSPLGQTYFNTPITNTFDLEEKKYLSNYHI